MRSTGYSIKDLEVLSGVKMHTIRIWEKRYDLLKPKRTDTNIRFYDDEDLRRLLNISLLTRNGYKISKIAGWDDAAIRETVIKIAENKTSHSDYIERLMLLLVALDFSGVENLLDQILKELEVEEAFIYIIFKLLERVGTYWQVGSVFPAQEHLITNLCRQKLISAIDQLKMPEKKGPAVLFFLPEGELHEMSLLLYAYLAKKRGYQIMYLGQSVPFEDLEKISQQKEIEFLFTAFLNSFSGEEIETYLTRLKNCFQQQKIFITGNQVQVHSPALPRNVRTVKDHKEFKKYFG